ncbi:MAG TPA: hypothetical protein VGP99_08165, partial [Tepidisphaeraceae bacterium]|nr:hypothetical protein [Tepidisphaeraceae bacterium]
MRTIRFVALLIAILSAVIACSGSSDAVSTQPPSATASPAITPTQRAHVVWLEDSAGWLGDAESRGKAANWVMGFNATHDDI